MQVTPRALAGPGEPRTALEVLRQAGWRLHDDELANTHAWSPDGLVYVGFLPEGDAGHPQHVGDADGGAAADWAADAEAPTRRVLWRIRAYRHPNAARSVWTATFDDATPAELVAAFLAATADPAPVTRDPLDPAGMLDNPPPDATP